MIIENRKSKKNILKLIFKNFGNNFDTVKLDAIVGVCNAIGELWDGDAKYIDFLYENLNHKNFNVNKAAIDSLIKIKQKNLTIDTLKKLAKSEERRISDYAIETLLDIEEDSEDITEAILYYMTNNDEFYIEKAILYCLKLKNPPNKKLIIDVLIKTLSFNKYSHIKKGAMKALVKLCMRDKELLNKVLLAIIKSFEDEEYTIKEFAIESLIKLSSI